MTGRNTERVWPYFASILAAPLSFLIAQWFQLTATEATDVFRQVAGFAAITAGFLGTTLTVLVSLDEKPVVRDLRRSKTYGLVIRYLIAGIRHSFGIALVSGLYMVVFPRTGLKHPTFLPWIASLWGGYAAFALCSVFRIFNLFTRIVMDDVQQEEHDAQVVGLGTLRSRR